MKLLRTIKTTKKKDSDLLTYLWKNRDAWNKIKSAMKGANKNFGTGSWGSQIWSVYFDFNYEKGIIGGTISGPSDIPVGNTFDLIDDKAEISQYNKMFKQAQQELEKAIAYADKKQKELQKVVEEVKKEAERN